MNYQEYLEAKRLCEIKIKVYSFAVYLASIFILFQGGLLVFKIDIHLSFINLVLIEKLFSMGYNRFSQGNVVFGIAFYAAFALIILSFVLSAFFAVYQKRIGYINVMMFYIIDSLVCIASGAYIPLLIHFILLIFMFLTLKNMNYLKLIKNNIWGI